MTGTAVSVFDLERDSLQLTGFTHQESLNLHRWEQVYIPANLIPYFSSDEVEGAMSNSTFPVENASVCY